jgi:glycine/D-amino acid oxidase-like deaminating enzyme
MEDRGVSAFEVVIIGAGIHGASAAFHLAREGVRVAVLERGFPASGPTGLSSAICRAYYTNPFLAGVARDSIAMLAELPDHTGGREAGFHRTGFLYLHEEADAPDVATTVARLNELGIRVDLLDLGGVADAFPSVDTTGLGVAAFEHDAGYADPTLATTALLDAARDAGTEVWLRASVVGIREERPGGVTISLRDGRFVDTERLLIAAGPWTRQLANHLGVELPLTVERHVVSVGAWGGAAALPFSHADVRAGYYFRPDGAERFCVGSLTPGGRVDPDESIDGIRTTEQIKLMSAVARRVPALMDAQPRGGWASLYDVSPDWQPVIGQIAEGVFVDAGTSGHGFKLAPMLGSHVAGMVMGRPDDGLAQFDPFRFATGRELAAGFGAARIIG